MTSVSLGSRIGSGSGTFLTLVSCSLLWIVKAKSVVAGGAASSVLRFSEVEAVTTDSIAGRPRAYHSLISAVVAIRNDGEGDWDISLIVTLISFITGSIGSIYACTDPSTLHMMNPQRR